MNEYEICLKKELQNTVEFNSEIFFAFCKATAYLNYFLIVGITGIFPPINKNNYTNVK